VVAESLTLRPVVRAWAVGPGGRPFARELQPVGLGGCLGPLLTVGGPLVEVLPAGDLVLVVTAGGAVAAHAPDASRLWTRPVPGWPASPQSRIWTDESGRRTWSAKRDGLTELGPDGQKRWAWRAPSSGSFSLEPAEVVRAAAAVLGVAPDGGPGELGCAYRRRSFETHFPKMPSVSRSLSQLSVKVPRSCSIVAKLWTSDRWSAATGSSGVGRVLTGLSRHL
jgi:hypothetical protein